MSSGLDITEGNTKEPYAFNEGLFKRMVNSTPTVIDAGNGGALVGAMNWPTNTFCYARCNWSCRQFLLAHKIPLVALHPIFEKLTLTANCQLKMRLRINQGQFTVVGTSSNSYVLKESIMSSGSVCPIMLASAESISPLAGKLDGSVQIGGDNVFNDSKQYDFSSFAEEIAKIGAIIGSLDSRLNCGLLDLNQWTYANRMLVADISRATHPDVPASVVVSAINAAAQGSDLLLLVVYERELELDVLAGEVHRAD
ncbi:hypothetical protein PybrP1_006277 [[Pythium] brassicae (nom. inval.)]|nr:hypothetical protein PybrP1_006277 [[Pythium] brassicae (nom. inval.)]